MYRFIVCAFFIFIIIMFYNVEKFFILCYIYCCVLKRIVEKNCEKAINNYKEKYGSIKLLSGNGYALL